MHRIIKSNIQSTNIRRISTSLTLFKTSAQSSADEGKQGSFEYCINQVKKFDRENYLAALCIRDLTLRRAVFALRAFNVELSLVRDSTTNSDRAKQRFFFWSKLVEEMIRRDAEEDPNVHKLNAYYKHAPVAKELLDLFYMIDMTDEIREWLKDLIGARVSSKVLGYKPFDSMNELELYCLKSNGSLYHLSSSLTRQLGNALNGEESSAIPIMRTISEQLGIAHGISNIIRGITYNSRQNCCYIPQDLLDKHNLTVKNFIGKNFDPCGVKVVVESLAMRCQGFLDEVHSSQDKIPSLTRDLFLPRVAIQSNLNVLKKCNYDLSDKRLSRRNNLLPLKLWISQRYFRAPII